VRWGTAVLCALLPIPGGCRAQRAANEDAATAPVSPAAVPPAAVVSAAASNPRHDDQGGAAIGCRAVAVDGEVRVSLDGDAGSALPLTVQGEVPSEAWLLVAARSRVVAKDPRTTRETTFFGPARVQACVGRREESWIGQGTFESAPGAGEAPGAEEWVTTPHGVVRYVSAALRVSVLPTETTVRLAGGMAFFWAADDVQTFRGDKPDAHERPDIVPNDEPWQRVTESNLRAVMRTPTAPADAARSSVGACARAAQRSQDLARALLSSERADGSDLGHTIAEQITARRTARASCSVAGLRAGALTAADTRTALSRMLERANARWSNLPDAH
jgi:hypothetical protein